MVGCGSQDREKLKGELVYREVVETFVHEEKDICLIDYCDCSVVIEEELAPETAQEWLKTLGVLTGLPQ